MTITRKKIWLSYSWLDNASSDVFFAAQQLTEKGSLDVRLDRWDISAGKRLWEQIASFITDPNETDAWALYATSNSFASEPCREEIAYALDRALTARRNFPVIGIFPTHVAYDLIPPAIRIRLFVSMNDPYWVERVSAAASGVAFKEPVAMLEPYEFTIWKKNDWYMLEARPRAGVWAHPTFLIPKLPATDVEQLSSVLAPRAAPPYGGYVAQGGNGWRKLADGSEWAFCYHQGEATPATSCYFSCRELPTTIIFGADGGPHFQINSVSSLPIKSVS